MNYYIYQITNNVNGKIYIGKHKTKDLNDGYFGSGKLLKRAIEKYGKENFTKEILFTFDSEEELNAKEGELVTEDFCLLDSNYNLCVGGQGGFSYINRESLRRRDFAMSLEAKQSISHGLKKYFKNNPRTKKEQKTRASDNGHTGLMWIYCKETGACKKIFKGENLPDGWAFGRKQKELISKSDLLKEHRYNEALNKFNMFKASGLSLAKFAVTINVSQPYLSMLWKRYNFQ